MACPPRQGRGIQPLARAVESNDQSAQYIASHQDVRTGDGQRLDSPKDQTFDLHIDSVHHDLAGCASETGDAHTAHWRQVQVDDQWLGNPTEVGAGVDLAIQRGALPVAGRAQAHRHHRRRWRERMAEAAPHSMTKPGISTVDDAAPTRPMKNVFPRTRFQTRSNRR